MLYLFVCFQEKKVEQEKRMLEEQQRLEEEKKRREFLALSDRDKVSSIDYCQ